ncbi:MAG: protein kinase domain-containing protein [Acidobacteriota bacterium]
MVLVAGTRLGVYEVSAALGAGGMGEVYRARDPRLGRDVAIKVLPARLTRDPSALARFEREAKVLASLSHPNILTIFDVGTEEGLSFVVMELLPGETLSSRIAQRRCDWPEAVRIGIEVAEGLSAAHARGIIHRDLKPENIFLTRDGHIKILDFGLARCSEDFTPAGDFGPTAELATATGVVMGTVPYMSPEQLKGVRADSRSDIFSFGCVLQETITAKNPFMRATRAETVSAILTDAAPSLKQFDPTIPAELDQTVKRCLNKQPDQRFQSAGDLAFHLRQILNNVSSARATTQVRQGTPRFNRRVAQTAAAVVVLLFLAMLGYWFATKRSSVASKQFKSIAVLPLQNNSGDPQQEYFVDGMTDSVIADLGKIRDLRVISRTSVMPFKNSKKSMREIAKELHVDSVIEGSVMRSADRARVTVQLIDAAKDQQLWSESYERDLKDVFVLQGQVADAIAQQVHAVVTPEEQNHIAGKRAIDPDVYELYLKGRHIMERGGLADVRKAIDYFQSGLTKDPNNGLLYAGLADAYIDKMMDVHESPMEATAKARVAAAKALQLDDSLAEAHTSLGMIKLSYDWDWAGAEHEFKRAMELNPGYPLAYIMYGQYLTMIGRQEEALPYFEKAHRLDPLFNESYRAEGYACFMAHKYDQAVLQYRKALELEPDAITYFGLVLARAEKGDYATAISEADKATKLNNSPLLLTSLASAYARAGRRADANRVLRGLEEMWERQGAAPAWHVARSPYVCPYEVAGVYAQLGDKRRAFEWLDRAYRNRSCLYWIRQDPRFDSIHSDPRFQELLAKMNFPQ